jgi:hypothetical protein
MKFFTTRMPQNMDEVDSLKEHIEIIYSYVKDFLDENDPNFTIPGEDDDYVYCLINTDPLNKNGTNHTVYTNLIIKDEDAIIDKIFPLKLREPSTKNTLFQHNVVKFFKQYSINISYNNYETWQELVKVSKAKEI